MDQRDEFKKLPEDKQTLRNKQLFQAVWLDMPGPQIEENAWKRNFYTSSQEEIVGLVHMKQERVTVAGSTSNSNELRRKCKRKH